MWIHVEIVEALFRVALQKMGRAGQKAEKNRARRMTTDRCAQTHVKVALVPSVNAKVVVDLVEAGAIVCLVRVCAV